MILKAWGNWSLFQELLSVLRLIGDRHGGVSIANVATRWVLDQPAVGAVIIGQCEISSYPTLAVHLFPCLLIATSYLLTSVTFHHSHPSLSLYYVLPTTTIIANPVVAFTLTWVGGPIIHHSTLRGPSSVLSRRPYGNRRTQRR